MTVQIAACDPASSAARAMGEALWEEIQRRYGFTAPYPFDPADYAGPVGGFWIALLDDRPVGSVALAERADGDAELDVMYVAPDARGAGVAQALLAALEEHARSRGVRRLVLRAGEPQPEAMRFYAAAGFTRIPVFGKWVEDPTSICLAKPVGG
ncbi:MAG TPA: GNAT family N-acetyltransferase [Mycobacteriales bacterium]|nr:GNAT family N-acetyltransferase [Mycobacteriales bacterium]